jgi:hypothetical protein
MPAAPQANLSFLPWVRQGAASAIATIDTLGPRQPAVADVSIDVQIVRTSAGEWSMNGDHVAGVNGLDDLDFGFTPATNTGEFESNCFPSIEFDRADFPGCSRHSTPTPTRSCGRGCVSSSCAGRRVFRSRAASIRRSRYCGLRPRPSPSSSCPT